MHLIGCDLHTRFQQMAMMDCQSGEIIERRLDHEAGEARKFYAALPGPGRIGMEATGRTQWFERLRHPPPVSTSPCHHRITEIQRGTNRGVRSTGQAAS